ncbi:FAD-dependent oxidoreductase [Vibrio sp. E150_011]
MMQRDSNLDWPEERISFQFEGEWLNGVKGESIASALTVAGRSLNAKNSRNRVFCGMGECQQCLVTVDGAISQRACKTQLKEGMSISRQHDVVRAPKVREPIDENTSTYTDLSFDVVIVGAGPGGLAAANTVASNGMAVLLVDENDSSGGQYFKQLQPELSKVENNLDLRHIQGRELIRKTCQSGVTTWINCMVWHAENKSEGGVRLLLNRKADNYRVDARYVIIATGARELPVKIPGWDLPGVMTCGGVQILKRRFGVLPKGPYLFIGNGPLLLNVAHDVSESMEETVAVLEMAKINSIRNLRPMTSMVFSDISLVKQGGIFRLGLLKKGISYQIGIRPIKIISVADGLMLFWKNDKGEEQRSECKTLVMSGGLVPNRDLARLLGAKPTENTKNGRSNLPHVYIIGEASNIGGYKKALLEGEAAGLDLLESIAKPDKGSYERVLKFQSSLASVFSVSPLDIDDATVICRCEQVRAIDVKMALKTGVSSARGLKQLTRIGMGRCQGRYCQSSMTQLLNDQGVDVEPMTQRTPIRPVPLGSLSQEQPEWVKHYRATPKSLVQNLSRCNDTLADNKPESDFVVIGGGLVGLFSAYHLAKSGMSVTLLDGGRTNGQASGGNAGSLHAQLLSFDFSESSALMPADHTLSLQCEAIDYWKTLELEMNADFELSQQGGLMVADNDLGLLKLEKKVARERRLGVDVELIDRAQLRNLEPALSNNLVGAALCHNEGKVNPHKVASELRKQLDDLGVIIHENCPVQAISEVPRGFVAKCALGKFKAGKIINAAGAWSGEIASMAGGSVPVFGAPLQMIVTEPVEKVTTRLIAHVGRHLTLKQANKGNFLIGGGWTAGYDPLSSHSTVMINSLKGNAWVAEHVMPMLGNVNVIRTWAAMNIDIDGAPVVGEDTKVKGLFHVVTSNGVTLAPLVGKMITELAVDGFRDSIRAEFLPLRFG